MFAVSVEVQSNSPITVGSLLTFHAALCNLDHSLFHESFVYVWTSNAVNKSTGFLDITTTASNLTAEMSKVFSLYVPPGHYVMKVQVFRKPDAWLMAFRHLSPVAVGYHNFTLTGIY